MLADGAHGQQRTVERAVARAVGRAVARIVSVPSSAGAEGVHGRHTPKAAG